MQYLVQVPLVVSWRFLVFAVTGSPLTFVSNSSQQIAELLGSNSDDDNSDDNDDDSEDSDHSYRSDDGSDSFDPDNPFCK